MEKIGDFPDSANDFPIRYELSRCGIGWEFVSQQI